LQFLIRSDDDDALAVRQAARVEDPKRYPLECPVYDDTQAACAAFPTPLLDWLNKTLIVWLSCLLTRLSPLWLTLLHKLEACRASLLAKSPWA
jgi:hypothetical protein